MLTLALTLTLTLILTLMPVLTPLTLLKVAENIMMAQSEVELDENYHKTQAVAPHRNTAL